MMRVCCSSTCIVACCWVLVLCGCSHNGSAFSPTGSHRQSQVFLAEGMVKEITSDGRTALIQHRAISNYMAAMTMAFRAKNPTELAGLQPGDEIAFRLNVSKQESWIDRVSKTGVKAPAAPSVIPQAGAASQPSPEHHPLLDYQFTNELGQPVTLSQFHGQALAITFFFTRCPIPDFCPRLSKNFEEASAKLATLSTAPTNWHFLSISFDPQFDTPPVLRA